MMMNNESLENVNAFELNDEELDDVTGGKSSQYIKTTGNVNVRKGPGLEYRSLGTVSKGVKMTYTGKSERDDRGVKWYQVSAGGRTGWISSRYAKKY